MKASRLYDELHAQLAQDMQRLPDKPEETAEATLRALWHRAAGRSVSCVRAMENDLPDLDDGQLSRLRELIRTRLDGVPLSHITGRQSFLGLELLAGPGALVPRVETQLLAKTAIELAQQMAAAGGQTLTVIDTCTGCGNVALAIAHHVPEARVLAADLSEDAVALARQNTGILDLSSRVELRCGNLMAPFEADEFLGHVDLLTCNPPYISTAKMRQMPSEIIGHEPALAFDGGPFGVSILMQLLKEAPRFLRSGGWLVFELGAGQGPGLLKRLQAVTGFAESRPLRDASGEIRVIAARRS